MKFFDRKEEVVDIQLTQYGKHLLSKGKFKPMYYEFFDDDVIYDSTYARRTEEQSETEDRIKETPRLKVQYVFSDREREQKKILEQVTSRENEPPEVRHTTLALDELVLPSPVLQDRTFFLSAQLGNSSLETAYAPAWSVKLEEGKVTGSVDYLVSEKVSFLKIPQMNFTDIAFESSVTQDEPIGGEEGASIGRGDLEGDVKKLTFSSLRYEDGTGIAVKGSGILLNVEEENVPFEKENFEIEVYKVEENDEGKEELIPLSFKRKAKKVVDGILLDPEEIEKFASDNIDETFVEHYFDLYVDDEIVEPEQIIEKRSNLYETKVIKDDAPFGDKCDEE